MANVRVSEKKQKKMQLVDELSEKLQKAKGFVLTDYKGLSVAMGNELKGKLKEAGATFTVTKNTLLKRALDKANVNLPEDLKKSLEGPTATMLVNDDEVAPLKAWAAFVKTHQIPVVKIGFFWGKFLNADEVTRLSKLPAKEVIYAQLVRGFNAPLQRLHRALSYNMQTLVYTLNQIKDKKQ